MNQGTKAARPFSGKAWAGLALDAPALLFWAVVLLSVAINKPSLAQPLFDLVGRYTMFIVVGVLLLLPLAGGILGALGFKRNRLAGGFAMLLGFGMAGFNLLFQSSPPPG